ncbi:Bax inhibitor-1/YccA family protein [Asticcacaulis sp. EMRT-3]|uniref:Bax inhibitor-1/YccA family protein n=1 Tax=Asticcacaulis sp. EMRT-3 TaxID=3040349 RepID=UPI0024AEEAFC|nr:Bax inhibitor-1/YccA family protein [Asticcacaulis sp. EMRT-3]MDI7776058.1 Bax inhibitor-1/YccA family protein [Asticcacaulis sp. EMRT-3]
MNDFVGQNTTTRPTVEAQARDLGLKRFLLGIYQKMALGLLLTGATAWAVAHSPVFLQMLYHTTGDGHIAGYTVIGYVFLFAPLGLSLASGLFMRNLNVGMMALFYWLFVAVMGVSLSSIFLLYTDMSLASTFFITAAAFGGLSIFGYTTKVNMTAWGSFLVMAVFGIIIASLVNVFLLHNTMFDLMISAAGVLIFSGLIAYKTQWLKNAYYQFEHNQTGLAAMTYYGALSLYISFINLFLSILRFTGGRR